MRLFIAFDVPDEAIGEIKKAQDEIRKADADLTLPKEFHLTLKFLGETEDKKVSEIKDLLMKIKFEQFDAELDGIGVFPAEDYIRVVWVGLEPADKIKELQQKIETALEGMFPKDTRFHPHLTLARVKLVKDKKGFIEKLKKIKIDKKAFNVSSFKLIKSTLTPEGPVYEVLEEFKANK